MKSLIIRSSKVWRTALAVTIGCLVAIPAPGVEGTGATGKHCLWKVTNAKAPFYLLASFHALRGEDYPLGPEIDHAIGECRRFVFEFNPKTDPAVWEKKMREAAHYPNGVTLKQKVRPETYIFVKKIAQVRATSYDEVKPWYIAFFMFHHPAFHNVTGRLAVERYVEQRAPSFSEFAGLETVDEHIHVLSDMSDIEGEVFLLQAMVYGDSHMAEFSRAAGAWKKGEVDQMVQAYATEEHEAPFLVWRLIDHRNANWIPKIEAETNSGKPTMIVAGARHFAGPHGVLALLRAKGYKIEQL